MNTILMKKHMLLLLFVCAGVISFAQESNKYEKFKTGTFTYAGDAYSGTKIVRTKSKQTEIINNGQAKVIMKIKWINDSTYVLTLVKAVNAPGCLKKGDTITTVITSSTGNQYTFRSETANCGGAEATIVKVED